MSQDLSLLRADVDAGEGRERVVEPLRWGEVLQLPVRGLNALLEWVWDQRMAISFALCLTLFVLLIMSVTRTQEARMHASQVQAEAQRLKTLHEFIGRMMGANHVGVLDQDYRSALTQRLDAHTPLIAATFEHDAEAQLQLYGIAANVHLALDDRARYSALRLQQAQLIARTSEFISPEFIASLLTDAENAQAIGEGGLAHAFLSQADTLIRQAALDQSRTRARWFALTGDLALGQGDSNAAMLSWSQAKALYAELGVTDSRHYATLVSLGKALEPWRPEQAVTAYIEAVQVANALPIMPVASLAGDVYPALAMLQERNGRTDAAVESMKAGIILLDASTNEAQRVDYALNLHRLGEPEDRKGILASLSPAQLKQRGIEIAEAMLAAGHLQALSELMISGLISPPIAPASARFNTEQIRYQLLQLKWILAGGKVWMTSRNAAALTDALESNELPEAWRARVQLALSEVAAARGQRMRAATLLHAILDEANGQMSADSLLAQLSLSRIAWQSGDVDQSLRLSTAAVLAYESFSAPHDRRLGPLLWTQHARALSLVQDAASARIWFQRARNAYLSLLPEPAASVAIEQIDQSLNALSIEGAAYEF